jgi:hypothetical protein
MGGCKDNIPLLRDLFTRSFSVVKPTASLIACRAATAASHGQHISRLLENLSSLSMTGLLLASFRGLTYSHLCSNLWQLTQAPPASCTSQTFPPRQHLKHWGSWYSPVRTGLGRLLCRLWARSVDFLCHEWMTANVSSPLLSSNSPTYSSSAFSFPFPLVKVISFSFHPSPSPLPDAPHARDPQTGMTRLQYLETSVISSLSCLSFEVP